MKKGITYLLFLFLICPLYNIGQNKINNYEYWFDNNYAGKTSVNITPVSYLNLSTAIVTTGVNNGLHVLHIRFKDASSHYSGTLSQFFQKLPSSASTTKQITAYEYWFDNDYLDKTYSTVTPQTSFQLLGNLNASSLQAGLHVVHIRFKDDGGGWSSVLSQFIQKVSGGTSVTNEINAYEYWFDNNYAGKVLQTVTAQTELQLLTPIDAHLLNDGLHIFHVRFRDIGNSWSLVLSQFIQKIPSGSSLSNEIIAFEYWFDNNYAGKVLQTVTAQSELQVLASINAQTINDGLHVFHVRFEDKINAWSSVISSFFIKSGQGSAISNVITNYRYWFDMADSVMFNVQLPVHSNILLLNSPLNLSVIHKGIHIIHFQFLDSLKQWSCVTSDSMYKYPTVTAAFTPSETILCDSGLVNLTNKSSIDADTFKWVFDDGTTSDSINATHYFSTYGTHPVKLIAYDTTMGVKDTTVMNITVVHSPVVHLGNDTAVCPPGITLNAWYPHCTYLWSNSSTDSILNVSSSGTYTVTVTNQYGCSNTAERTVTINSNPIASATSNSAICAGHTLDLSAGSGTNYIFSWSGPNSFSSSNQYPAILNATTTDAGTYTVTVTISTTGCSATAQTTVTINTNPVATASSNSAICAGNTLDLTSGGGSTYNWSGPNSFSSTNQNPAITSATTSASGTYTVTVTNSTTGCSSTAQTIVTVNSNPAATASSNSPICAGKTLNLASGGGTNYNWSGPNSFTNVNQNPAITSATTSASGTYTVTVTNSTTGCSATANTNVTINPLPVIHLGNDTTICLYHTITLSAGSGFSSYHWNTGQTTQTITVGTTGTYSVQVGNSFGCIGADTIHVSVDTCAGIAEYNRNDFISIFPNPNNGLYYIKALTDFNDAVDIKITDLSGRLLFHKGNNLLIKDEVLPIDNEKCASGVYMLYLTSESVRIIQKIIIDH
ncbi:MAG: PKD domain-containing protein [Bacteroidales bacterium]|jgi:hypothetical protein